MEQYTERHYDDDLTIGSDDYDDSFQTPDIDLFEYAGADDSPISRLKSLVLSIDWEITDEVLLQFNEELLDLKDVWAGDQIKQVYLQALEKISKYIYREKADANPNSIKLLLSLYYNLEKIVSSAEITEEEKKQLLLEDVRNFEKLKHQIKKMVKGKKNKGGTAGPRPKTGMGDQGTPSLANALTTLKAVILGIDWEITEKELLALQQEVGRLHEVFLASRPKLIFLQGIGTLGAYIRNKKSNAHADAFKLLHSFFAGLEQIVNTPLSLAEEKAILMPEVAKFNTFKEIISTSMAADSLRDEDEAEEAGKWGGRGDIRPAFADIPGETKGFQEEEAAAALGISANFDNNIEKFFGEESARPVLSGEFARSTEQRSSLTTDGIQLASPIEAGRDRLDLEDQEEDEERIQKSMAGAAGELSPALADVGDHWQTENEIRGPETAAEDAVADELMTRLDDFFAQEAVGSESQFRSLDGSPGAGTLIVPAELALQGVNVETEGDDLEGADEISAAVAEKSSDWQPPSPALETAAVVDSPWPEAEEMSPVAIDDQDEPVGEAEFVLAEPEEIADLTVDSVSADLLADDELFAAPTVSAEEWQYPAEAADTCEEVRAIADDQEMLVVDEELLMEPFERPEIDSQSAFDPALPAAELGAWADQSGVDLASEDQAEKALAFADSFDEMAAEQEPTAVETDRLDGPFHDDFEAIADLTHADVDFILRASADSEELLAPLVQDEMVLFADHLPEAEPESEYAGYPAAVAEVDENGFAFDRLADEWADDGGLTVPGDGSEIFPGDEKRASAVFADVTDDGDLMTDDQCGEEVEVDDPDCALLAEAGHALSAASTPINTDIAGLIDGLGETIALLGRQSGDDVVQLLFRYINCLRQKWVGQPLAKIYLQLLSSVAQHIERRGDQADAGAQDLLRTVFRYLRGSWKNFELGQDQLLCATCKVLQWQHDMMMRPPVSAEVTSLVPGEDLKAEPSTGTIGAIFGVAGTDRIGCANAVPEAEELSSAVLRRELDFLRHALQDELAELRSALKTTQK